jgi:Dyp-type peroxidase family
MGDNTASRVTLDLGNIQGNIVPGFNKDHQAFLLVTFRDGQAGRQWLTTLQPEVASAKEVLAFKDLFQTIRGRRPDDPTARDRGTLRVVSATWTNVAVTFSGLQLTGAAGDLARFPTAFQADRVPGVQPIARQADIHALVIVAADHIENLDATVQRERQRMLAHRVAEVASLRGDTLPGDQRGHEQFGFADGVSQPLLAGTSIGNGPPVAAGEFVLGYPDQTGIPSGHELPDWTRHGSFLAFLQLQQQVGAFRSSMRRNAEQLGLRPEELAASIVGRYQDGSPIEPSSRFSHVGRGSPSWLLGNEWLRHRLIRRGIPYGQPLAEGARDDGQRGLFFLCYQADIARQFEYVWAQFLNGPDFPIPSAGRDALTGLSQYCAASAPNVPSYSTDSTPTDARLASAFAGQRGRLISLRLPAFVIPRYGGYFFTPSVSAIAELGREPHASIPAVSSEPERSNYGPT